MNQKYKLTIRFSIARRANTITKSPAYVEMTRARLETMWLARSVTMVETIMWLVIENTVFSRLSLLVTKQKLRVGKSISTLNVKRALKR